jgi:UDP-N-acetylglucosamine acyltransferase
MINANAVISKTAQIGADVSIAAGVIIEDAVTIGAGCRIEAYVIIHRGTVLGERVHIGAFSVLGARPTMLEADATPCGGLHIGADSHIDPNCIIACASKFDENTQIGAACELMAAVHIDADCVLGDSVRISNHSKLAGSVQLADQASIGSFVCLHASIRVGHYAQVGDHAVITADIPPYTLATQRDRVDGLNEAALLAADFSKLDLNDLKRCYQAVYCVGTGELAENAKQALREHEFAITRVGARFLSFFEGGSIGFICA